MSEVIHLEACCLASIQDIRDVRGIEEFGKVLIATSPLIVLTGSNPIDASLSIGTTDWDLVSLAVKAVPLMEAGAVRRIAYLEIARHKGGSLNKFWKSMYHSFGAGERTSQ